MEPEGIDSMERPDQVPVNSAAVSLGLLPEEQTRGYIHAHGVMRLVEHENDLGNA